MSRLDVGATTVAANFDFAAEGRRYRLKGDEFSTPCFQLYAADDWGDFQPSSDLTGQQLAHALLPHLVRLRDDGALAGASSDWTRAAIDHLGFEALLGRVEARVVAEAGLVSTRFAAYQALEELSPESTSVFDPRAGEPLGLTPAEALELRAHPARYARLCEVVNDALERSPGQGR